MWGESVRVDWSDGTDYSPCLADPCVGPSSAYFRAPAAEHCELTVPITDHRGRQPSGDGEFPRRGPVGESRPVYAWCHQSVRQRWPEVNCAETEARVVDLLR